MLFVEREWARDVDGELAGVHTLTHRSVSLFSVQPMNPRRLWTVLMLAALAIAGCAEPEPLSQADELISRKRYSPAIVIYDQILLENPASVAALIGRGRAHAAAGKTELALADFSAAIAIAPDRSEAYYRRALVFESLGKLAEAEADQESAHSVDPNYRWAFANVEQTPTPRMTDEEYEDDVEDREAQSLSAEQEEATATSTESLTNTDDRFERPWVALPEPLPPNTSALVNRREAAHDAWRPGFVTFELLDESTNSNGLSKPWQTESRFRTPFWLRPNAASAAADRSKPATATKPRSTAAPAATPRQTPPTNPFVRAPVSAPAAKGQSPQSTTTAPATNGTSRPTGSPFPQAPVPSTGR